MNAALPVEVPNTGACINRLVRVARQVANHFVTRGRWDLAEWLENAAAGVQIVTDTTKASDPLYIVAWSRNSAIPNSHGQDKAYSEAEAFALASLRCRFGGIPGNATVVRLSDGAVLRNYRCDMDAHVSYSEPAVEVAL